jgi:serine protease inhibitor
MRLLHIISPACFVVLVACRQGDVAPGNSPDLATLSTAEVNVVKANNDFSFNLFRDIQKQNENSNVFISPLSVSMALGMAMNGASATTQQSILSTIQFGSLSPLEVDQAFKDLTNLLTHTDRTTQIDLANSVWYSQQFTVRDSFATDIQQYYDGKIQALDFASPSSSQIINSWIASKTNNQIKDLVVSIEPAEVMFLVNAVYFKGTWMYPFDATQTQSGTFVGENGLSESVMMMNGKQKFREFNNSQFVLLDLPYGNGQFSMAILEPNQGVTISQISPLLSTDSLTLWLNRADSVNLGLTLPKFNVSWKNDLKENLEDLGMAVKGFPYFFQQPLSLEISRVLHQATIAVDEAGTEAAGATGIGITITAVRPPLVINRPFLYFIREKHSGTILFMGQLYNPAAN